jgi:hypothetical protein
MSEYRYFVAQRRAADLHEVLKIRPLAVTGVLMCTDGVVVGRRSGKSEMDADMWELVPSGGVDQSAVEPDGRVNLERSLLTELAQEIGIAKSDLNAPPRAIVLVEDVRSHVTDIGMRLDLRWSARDVLERFASIANREYSALEAVPLHAIPAFRLKHGQSLSPVSAALLDVIAPPGGPR